MGFRLAQRFCLEKYKISLVIRVLILIVLPHHFLIVIGLQILRFGHSFRTLWALKSADSYLAFICFISFGFILNFLLTFC